MAYKGLLIGFGYWGRNIARNLSQSIDVDFLYLVEKDEKARIEAQQVYPDLQTFESIESYLLVNSNADLDTLAFVATQASNHFDSIQKLLIAKHHVWCEKPITLSSEEAIKLKSLSLSNSLTIFIDHTYVYSPAVSRMKLEIEKLGGIRSINIVRHGFGKIQPDTNVIWDLAVHDLAIINFLTSYSPKAVIAFPMTLSLNQITSAQLIVEYPGFNAAISCSWLSPVKIRDIHVLCEKGSVIFDELDVAEKVKVIKQHVEVQLSSLENKSVNYRLGDTYIPELENKEPLSLALQDFVTAVKNNINPVSNIDLGIEIVNTLEHADLSLTSNGSRIEIG